MDSGAEMGVDTLIASWAALVRASGGTVESTPSFAAARCRHAVFNNALLLSPSTEAVSAVVAFYAEQGSRWALWTGERATSAVASASGLIRDGGTTGMWRSLDDLPRPADVGVVPCSPETVAEINGLSGEIVRGADRFQGIATVGRAAGLLMFRHADDTQLSFVATRPDDRRQGLATALVTAALHAASRDGATTVTLQAAPGAVSLYERLGFTVAGGWHEWALPS